MNRGMGLGIETRVGSFVRQLPGVEFKPEEDETLISITDTLMSNAYHPYYDDAADAADMPDEVIAVKVTLSVFHRPSTKSSDPSVPTKSSDPSVPAKPSHLSKADVENIVDQRLRGLLLAMLQALPENQSENIPSMVGVSQLIEELSKAKATNLTSGPALDAEIKKIPSMVSKMIEEISKPAATNDRLPWIQKDCDFFLDSLIRNGHDAKKYSEIKKEFDRRTDLSKRTLRGITQKYPKLAAMVDAIEGSGGIPSAQDGFVSLERYNDLRAVVNAVRSMDAEPKKRFKTPEDRLAFWKEKLLEFGVAPDVVAAVRLAGRGHGLGADAGDGAAGGGGGAAGGGGGAAGGGGGAAGGGGGADGGVVGGGAAGGAADGGVSAGVAAEEVNVAEEIEGMTVVVADGEGRTAGEGTADDASSEE